jgi:hypothetical protein
LQLRSAEITGTAAGGGGGSSLVPAAAVCPTVVESGVRAGDGLVVVRYKRGKRVRRACRVAVAR